MSLDLQAPAGALPVPGQVFAFDLQITSATAATASAAELRTGRTADDPLAWDEVSFPLPTGFALPANQPVTFPIQLACNEPSQPIEIWLDVDGRTVMRRFYLLPQNLNVAMGGSDTVVKFGTDGDPPVSPRSEFALPAAAASGRRRPA